MNDAVGGEGQGAVGGAGDQGRGQRVAVGVGVVAQRPGRGDGQRGVLGGGVGVVDRDGASLSVLVTVMVTVANCW